MQGVVGFIDELNERIGRWVSWLTLVMVLLYHSNDFGAVYAIV